MAPHSIAGCEYIVTLVMMCVHVLKQTEMSMQTQAAAHSSEQQLQTDVRQECCL